jgi:LPXTG-motif cell wall-anchored protein
MKNKLATFITLTVVLCIIIVTSNFLFAAEEVTVNILLGDTITCDGDGVEIDGQSLTITKAATYEITGSLDDGQIMVETEDEDKVEIILNGVDISCSDSAPIYIISGEVKLILEDENTVTDTANYVYEEDEDEPNASIFAKDDLTIKGDGTLTVNANYNDGINCKDDLKISSGTIDVKAVDEGLRGKESIKINGGNITIDAGGDGLKADEDEDEEKGYVEINGGVLDIISQDDGINAYRLIEVNDGEMKISAVSQAFKSDDSVIVNDGDITVLEANEGIEAPNITFNGGVSTIDAIDDALNASSSSGTSSEGEEDIPEDFNPEDMPEDFNPEDMPEDFNPEDMPEDFNPEDVPEDFEPGEGGNGGNFENGEQDDGSKLIINDGTLYLSVQTGDTLDSNGSLDINGGTVVVHGPDSNIEVGADCNGTFTISGGYSVIAGSRSNMSQYPTGESSQYTIAAMFDSIVEANSAMCVKDESGEELVIMKPENNYGSLIFSSEDLELGSTYKIYTGGTVSGGTEINGLVTDGSYSGGTLQATITIDSSPTTTSGEFGFGGGGQGDRPTDGEFPDSEETDDASSDTPTDSGEEASDNADDDSNDNSDDGDDDETDSDEDSDSNSDSDTEDGDMPVTGETNSTILYLISSILIIIGLTLFVYFKRKEIFK